MTKEEHQGLVSDFQNGMSNEDIKKKYGVSHRTIHYNVRKAGVVPEKKAIRRYKKLSPIQLSAMYTMADMGVKKTRIAKTFGVSRGTVHTKLRERSILVSKVTVDPPAKQSLIDRIVGWFRF